jgi:Fe-S-cluster containining protein
MKETILSTIYSRFDEWSADQQFYCRAGCAVCCTTNVTITALEGQRVLRYCQHQGLMEWLGGQLAQSSLRKAPKLTTNEFVAALLHGQEVPSPDTHSEDECFFLQDNRCIIYPMRPFSCRCFASTTPCSKNDAATVADTYLEGSTAAMQIIEHLGQFDSWGYMSDILILQAHLNNYLDIVDSELLKQANARLRRAQPISGFIIPEDEKNSIASLLQSIFSAPIDSRTIEQILNGKKAC